MATLQHLASRQCHELQSSHIAGRSHACQLRLESRRASAEHAAFRWTGSAWHLRDLGSTNGTFVNDHRLEPGEPAVVAKGSRIAFGDMGDVFQMVDDAPPRALARAADGTVALAQGGILVLPDAEYPEITIFEDSPGTWRAESQDGERRIIQDGETLVCGSRPWRLALPLVLENTWKHDGRPKMLADVGLRFSVSQFEEHVEIAVVHGDQAIALQTRKHGYLLLALAKARLRDGDNPRLPEPEHGWLDVEELTTSMFDGEPNRFHVALYRAKQQLAEAQVSNAAMLFERRPVARQIRLSVKRLEIQPLSPSKL